MDASQHKFAAAKRTMPETAAQLASKSAWVKCKAQPVAMSVPNTTLALQKGNTWGGGQTGQRSRALQNALDLPGVVTAHRREAEAGGQCQPCVWVCRQRHPAYTLIASQDRLADNVSGIARPRVDIRRVPGEWGSRSGLDQARECTAQCASRKEVRGDTHAAESSSAGITKAISWVCRLSKRTWSDSGLCKSTESIFFPYMAVVSAETALREKRTMKRRMPEELKTTVYLTPVTVLVQSDPVHAGAGGRHSSTLAGELALPQSKPSSSTSGVMVLFEEGVNINTLDCPQCSPSLSSSYVLALGVENTAKPST